VAPRNFALRFLTGVEALDGLLLLMIGEFRPAAKPDAARHGTGAVLSKEAQLLARARRGPE
jgi:hypothetical protein